MKYSIHGVDCSGEDLEEMRSFLRSEAGKRYKSIISALKTEEEIRAKRPISPSSPLDFQLFDRECHNSAANATSTILDIETYISEMIK